MGHGTAEDDHFFCLLFAFNSILSCISFRSFLAFSISFLPLNTIARCSAAGKCMRLLRSDSRRVASWVWNVASRFTSRFDCGGVPSSAVDCVLSWEAPSDEVRAPCIEEGPAIPTRGRPCRARRVLPCVRCDRILPDDRRIDLSTSMIVVFGILGLESASSQSLSSEAELKS